MVGVSKLNAVILALIVYDSGGLRFIPAFGISMLIIVLIAAKIALNKRIYGRGLFVLLSLACCMLGFVFLISGNEIINDYLVYLSYIFIAIFFLYSCKLGDNIVLDLFFALKIFLYQSLISFLFQFIVGGNLSVTDVAGQSVLTFFHLFYYPGTHDVYPVLRNLGLFWEPGVFQIYMNILFFISVFLVKNRKYTILSFFAVLTTLSTTGYVVLMLQILYKMYLQGRLKKVVFILCSIPFLYFSYSLIEDKLYGSNSRSSLARQDDFIASYNVMLENPYLGVGLDTENYKYIHYRYSGLAQGLASDDKLNNDELASRGTTNSVIFTLCAFGIPLGGLFFYAIYRQRVFPRYQGLFFFMVIIFGSSEPILLTPFFTVIAASGIRFLIFGRRYHKAYNRASSSKKIRNIVFPL